MPVGGYPKSKIREIAADIGLKVADKPDSQDICFLPDGNYQKFLEENGIVLVSGIIDTRREEVVEALASHGYQVIDSREEKGWCAMAATATATRR